MLRLDGVECLGIICDLRWATNATFFLGPEEKYQKPCLVQPVSLPV